MQAGRQRAHSQGLGQSGHALEQDVAIGEHGDEQALHQHLLAHEDAAYLSTKGFDPG
jgi:hypothetical protein